MLLEDSLLTPYGHTFRYASVGGESENLSRDDIASTRLVKRTYSDSAKDPLKRFEYLRNGKATSVMIRATPNAVRWDEINRIQYRFQALNFHSDVLDALIQNSPPLSRREHNVASNKPKNENESDKNNNNIPLNRRDDNNNNQNGSLSSDDEDDETDLIDATSTKKNVEKIRNTRSGKLRSIRRSNSADVRNEIERKASVVQVGPKDDTSDYNSDEEVFQTRSEGDIDFNTTICHVKTGQIKDTTQIHVQSYNTTTNNMDNDNKPFTKKDLNLLADPSTYGKASQRQASSAPASTKISVVTPIESVSINDRFRSEITNLGDTTSEDLSAKSKEDLIELVKSLQRELETSKQQQCNHSSPQMLSTRSSCSRQDSISEEISLEEEADDGRSTPAVSTLIENFEKREGFRLQRSSTLPYRIRKAPS
ncbi:uncharacterized protein DDB_G0288805-like isoform X2 [Clytia hemisphaerica]|uniref:Uncharacterized protein n=1 Tax=Clytia hemisphaerica TaxID=252671 RepID=A0A7M5WQY7_9CNID